MSRLAAAVIAVCAVVLAACGQDDPGSGADAFERVEQQEAGREAEHEQTAAPRWEEVKTVSGTGDRSVEVAVDEGAIQWRIRWTCEGEEFSLSAGDEQLAGGPCAQRGSVTAVQTGDLALEVGSDDAWRLTIEQQVDTPLHEPAPPAIASGSARLLAAGDFYRIENPGRGRARLFQMPDGRVALRLEGFRTTPSLDLFVWLSEAIRPRTTKQVLASDHREIAALKATMGNHNYLLPGDYDPSRARSVVIWCEPIRIAYTAASLER